MQLYIVEHPLKFYLLEGKSSCPCVVLKQQSQQSASKFNKLELQGSDRVKTFMTVPCYIFCCGHERTAVKKNFNEACNKRCFLFTHIKPVMFFFIKTCMV